MAQHCDCGELPQGQCCCSKATSHDAQNDTGLDPLTLFSAPLLRLRAAVALQQLISQVSYKNELIFTIIGDRPSLSVPLLHLQQGLYNMG
jgi:hypothetical protein